MEPEEQVVEPQIEPEEQLEESEPEVALEDNVDDKETQARRQLTARAKAAEARAKAAEAALEKAKRAQTGLPSLDVDDYIDISTSLDGLDPRQKAYLAEQHKLSGKPMKDIRASEDFQLWNEAYTLRQQREAALKPSATQEQEEVAKPFAQKLKGASLEEKEAMLREQGLYKDKRPRVDKVDIGQKRSLY